MKKSENFNSIMPEAQQDLELLIIYFREKFLESICFWMDFSID